MNTNKYKFIGTIGILLVLLAISFFLGKCSNETKEPKVIKTIVTIPGVSGKSKIIEKPVPYEVIKDSIIYKDSIVFQENKELLDRFNKIKSEADKLSAYQKSIELNKYNIPYEDEFIKTNALITTRGTVESFQQLYEIKERKIPVEIQVPEKKSFLGISGVYVGAGTSTTVDLTKFNFEAGLGLELKSGNIIEGAYDTNKNIHLRYKFKL